MLVWRFKVLACLAAAALASGPAVSDNRFTGEWMPYDAFDALPKTHIAISGGELDIGFAPGEMTLPQSAYVAWAEKSAHAVATYYGRFPVKRARVLIVPVAGKGINHAKYGVAGSHQILEWRETPNIANALFSLIIYGQIQKEKVKAPVGTVGSRIRRCLAKLKDDLGHDE